MDTYHVFGFDVESDISLPELPPAQSTVRPVVSIRLGQVEKFQANVALRFGPSRESAMRLEPVTKKTTDEGNKRSRSRLRIRDSGDPEIVAQPKLLELHLLSQ